MPRNAPDISIVLPTLNEAQNIERLIRGIFDACSRDGISAEVIVVDDASSDGTAEIVEKLRGELPISIIRRPRKMGITSAVLDGLDGSEAPVVGAMDSDFSHPPHLIPRLVEPLISGRADMTIASRRVEGGGVEDWPLSRRIISGIANLLSRPLATASDPMSGFFFVRKESLEGVELTTRGWKICLEILVKARPKRVLEVPYVFRNRSTGSSKMGLGVVGGFLVNLLDLYAHRFMGSSLSRFLKFCTVGGIGVFLNLAILYLLVEYGGLWYMISATASFFIVALNNFFWNKIWTFQDMRAHANVLGSQLGKYLVASIISLGINLLILRALVEGLGMWYLEAQLGAIGVAVTVNFSLNSLWVFRGRSKR